MNSTRWVTLTEFVKHLGRSGVARVDETEKGWFIAWIDNSPKALEKQVSATAPKFAHDHVALTIRSVAGGRTPEGTLDDVRRTA